MIASDVEGFAGVAIPFEIEVGVHLLVFSRAEMVINATAGAYINFAGLSGNLELDGATPSSSRVSTVTAQTPTWLTFDNSSFTLMGTAPVDATPCTIVVQATDIYGDIANATILIDFIAGLFRAPIGQLNATIGASFAFDLSIYLSNKSDVEITDSVSPATSWLSFDMQTFILSGTVPSSTMPSLINITLNAISKTSNVSNSESFTLTIISAKAQTSGPSSKISPTQASTTSSSSASKPLRPLSANSHTRLSNRIIAAIAVPITLVFTALLCSLLCYRKRRLAAKQYPASPSKSEISAPIEAPLSVVEITTPTRVIPPEPLQLDTSGFGDIDSSGNYVGENRSEVKMRTRKSVSRSQTVSVLSGAVAPHLEESETSGKRVRAYSDNALSKTDRSWRSTQDSTYPTISSRTNTSQKLTRNYSRKGHTRRSAQTSSSDYAPRASIVSVQPQESSILNLRDSNFTFTPLDNFSVLSTRSTMLETPGLNHSSERLNHAKSARRKSKVIPIDRTGIGIGHSKRGSIRSFGGVNVKRRSAGHGRDWMVGTPDQLDQGLVRNSRTWLTVNSGDTEERSRRSQASNLTDSMDLTEALRTAPVSIKQVPKSPIPSPSVRLSQSSNNSRPVSRRIGSSPFFGGSSFRSSRKSSKRVRTSYADSPTVPEESSMVGTLENVVVHGLREEIDPPRDSFGISYGSAREGTRQLRSYIQSQLGRSKTIRSMKSAESKDSRFESASSSMQSFHQSQIFRESERIEHERREVQGDEYEDYLPDEYSDGSWETQRDSQGNVIEYSEKDSPERPPQIAVTEPKVEAHVDFGSTFSRSNPNTPLPDLGPNARILPGALRRPMSVDAKANKRASRAKIEQGELDYTAYI